MKIIKKLFNIATDILFYLFVAAILGIIIGWVGFGIETRITMSGSMEPAIQTGSICFVDTKAEYSEIQEGDVIAFENVSGGMVTHRVISITEEGMETKGDNNDISDGITTTEENFYGKTLFSIPKVGFVIHFFQKPANAAIALVIIVTIIILGRIDSKEEAEKTGKKKRRGKEEKGAESVLEAPEAVPDGESPETPAAEPAEES